MCGNWVRRGDLKRVEAGLGWEWRGSAEVHTLTNTVKLWNHTALGNLVLGMSDAKAGKEGAGIDMVIPCVPSSIDFNHVIHLSEQVQNTANDKARASGRRQG